MCRSLTALGAAVLCLTWSPGARAQQVILLGESIDIVEFEMLTSGSEAPNVPATKSKDKEPKEESKLSKRLAKLKYDRRPSAVLEAWSTPQDPRPELPPDPNAEVAETPVTAEDGQAADGTEPPAVEPAPMEAGEHGEQGEQASPETDPADANPADANQADADQAGADGSEAEGAAPTAEEVEDTESEPELTEEEAAAEAAEAKAVAKAEKKRAKAEAKAEKEREKEREKAEAKAVKEYEKAEKELVDWELENLRRMVTLGDWTGVRTYLTGLEDFEAKAGYDRILTSLVEGPVKVSGPLATYAEKNFLAPEDLIGLVAASPVARGEFENAGLGQVAKLFQLCVNEGTLFELCLDAFRTALEDETYAILPTQFARILIEAGYPTDAGEFLPEPDEAIAGNEREALNLLTRYYLAVYAEEKRTEHLEHAWATVQAALAQGDVEDEDKEEALKRAVAIAPDVSAELGKSWLEESFTIRPERGMEILRVIGSGTSKGLFDQAQNAEQRLEGLKLQTTAAEALLAAAPELATEWADTLTLLASTWLQEAVHSYAFDQSTSRGPSVTRDIFGNVFYSNWNSNRVNRNIPKALVTDEVLDIRPSDEWLALVSSGMRPKFSMVTAQLLLKVNEEEEAFPYIERLAREHPEDAKDLAHEFLRVWTRNNNPNAAQDRTGQFMFIYGFDARGGGIPLTRSKQERNLTALAGWVKRLRQLPFEDLDEELIATAFTSAHSKAEVYQLETIERVFGDMDGLEPETLSNLVQKMRTNLADVWRLPAVQRDNKTRRRQKDIQTEILRGYEVAGSVATKALLSHPDSWSLMLAGAAVAHDENNYRHELAKSAEFAGKRREALADFARAAELYGQRAPELKLDEETVEVYQTWFYASLGACDLKLLDHEKQPAVDQYPLISDALERLPAEAGERAMASFANSLFTRMSNVNPAVKFRYVRAGLEIVGDHPRARDAQEVAEYYGDLVTEIELETRIDGSDQVGHEEPFGMFINIRHTGAIEREAGGFSKYLVNQNNNNFGFNYGRPPEDYRDKFEEAARETLAENFDVLSVTFNHPETNSRATAEYGWRITPYAYVLMKARGPEIDRVPPLRLDLDFSDTTGYAVLPAQSAPLAIDAGSTRPARPFTELSVIQTLDERQAKDGKLLLEIQASALGLVPELDTFLDLAPAGFDITSTEDQGVSVAKFDEEADETAVLTERIWIVSLSAQEGLETLPETFEFGTDLTAGAEMEYQRYADADLETVTGTVSLEQSYGTPDTSRYWSWGLGLLAALAALAGGITLLRRRPTQQLGEARFRIPDTVSPFTVIGLLRDIESNNGLTPVARQELLSDIQHIEGYYFDDLSEESPDLDAIARTWVSTAKK